MNASGVELRRDFQRRFPFVAKVGVELIKCKNECRQKTALIVHLERKVKVLETELRTVTRVSERKFAAWEKLLKDRWKEQCKDDVELLKRYEKTFEEHFESTLNGLKEHVFRAPTKGTAEVGSQTEAQEDENEIEILGETRVESTEQPASNDSGHGSFDGEAEAPKQQRLSSPQAVDGSTRSIQPEPMRQLVQQPMPQIIQPIQLVQAPQAHHQMYGMPQQLIFANGICYATNPQPTAFIVQRPPTVQYVIANKEPTRTTPKPRKRAHENRSISATQPEIIDVSDEHATRDKQSRTESRTGEQDLQCGAVETVDTSPPDGLPQSGADSTTPKCTTPHLNDSDKVQKGSGPQEITEHVIPSSTEVPPSEKATFPNSEQDKSLNKSGNSSYLQKYIDPSESPRPSSNSSSNPSLTATPKPTVHLRRRFPYKFTAENSDRVEVEDFWTGQSFGWCPRPQPVVPKWNHFRAKHACRLSISISGECGKVVDGKIRELTVHVDYESKKKKSSL
uniref:MATH domain-containing protein n=1 Tax=Steinernema glaseri TaxID=37863 RepID=A0A1I7ZVM0_9BILA